MLFLLGDFPPVNYSSPCMPRYLSKSQFALGAQCPTKLFYSGKSEYIDSSADSTFLGALAEGGYQVGFLAQLTYPEGKRVDTLCSERALLETTRLLEAHTTTIFEAALSSGSTLIRVDVLIKDGTNIDLIEVKAKSYSRADGDLRANNGGIRSEFRPYLLDIAFQRLVARRALPGHHLRAHLLFVDKDAITTADGLNSRFHVRREAGRLKVEYSPPTCETSLGAPLLYLLNVDAEINQIEKEQLPVGGSRTLPFAEAASAYADAYQADIRLEPRPSGACSSCQFRSDAIPTDAAIRSGFQECWSEAFGWTAAEFIDGTVLDLWNFRRKDELIAQGVLKPRQVTPEHLRFDGAPPGPEGLTAAHRQWYMCQPDWPGGGAFYFDAASIRREMASWDFPLHFIDFETCAVAIPFSKGRHPYSVTAFQFSHHVLLADGTLKHQTQWLSTEPGVDPNFPFVRALRDALGNDHGTIFRWATHERTVLNEIREQLVEAESPPADAAELIAFIDSIASRAEPQPPRAMVDLCVLSGKYFFHPMTKGSASLKKVLPALMRCSPRLSELYRRPSYGSDISLNVQEPMAWWQERDGQVVDPYLLLPPLFLDVSRAEVDALEEGLPEELREGGAAMAAYIRLQAESLPEPARAAIKTGLLRYCELDTLAMVMVVQAWQAWVA